MKKINKKGTALDIFWIIIGIAMTTSVVYLVVWAMLGVAEDPLKMVANSSDYNDFSDDAMTNYARILDYGFAITFFVLLIMSILFAYMIKTHPVMFFLTIFVDILVVFSAYVAKLTFDNMLTIDILAGTDVYFPILSWVMSNLVIITIVMLVIQAVFMYSAFSDGAL